MTNKMFAEKDSNRIEREITKLRVLVGMICVSLKFHARPCYYLFLVIST
jgi:hypothetical protein